MDADFGLIRRMKAGEDGAIEAFVRKYYPAVLRYCYLHLCDKGYAEDATQEVFARFFRTLSQYRHYGKALNYLYVIAANICRDFSRKPRESSLEELSEEPVWEMPPLDTRLDVQAALAKLPPELREVTILFFFQQRKQTEIARILGIGLPLVKYRLRRAKELLAGYLGKEDV